MTVAVNGFVADLAAETLRDGAGNPVVLRAQTFAVLRHLAANPNRLVTKDELMKAVWPGIAVTDDSLVQCIHEIRRAIGDGEQAVLKTVHRRGYRLDLPDTASPVPASAPQPPAPVLPRRRIAIGLAAVVVLLVAGPAAWVSWGGRGSRPADSMPSIVVLPFENLRADTKQAYFADGITEDLIADLSKLSGIFVIAKNTAWSYRQRPIDVEKAARDLGVRYVLDGSVRRDGARLRINAELLDMVADRLLWADRFDGTIEDVFALQDKVIAQIVSALAVRLTGAESARAEAETENPQAYDAFSQGRDFLRRDTEADTLRAIALFEKAVALDPGYSRAYAALAAAQWRVTLSFWFSASGAGWQRAYDGLVGSLAKAKTKPTALAYAVSAQLLSQQGRYPEALAEVERALALAPSEPDGHLARAAVLNATGRAAEAEEEVRLAMRSDPYSAPATLRLLAISLFNQERYDEAARTLERIIALTPDAAVDYSTLISALGHLGRLDRVPALIEEYNALAVPAAHDPLTVQESAWDWYGVAFDYHRPYLLRMQAGLRKAGVPEGAGTDLSLDDYAGLVVRRLGEFEVKGIPRIDATEARSLRGRGVSFVDVRAHLDFRKGHIPGAVNLSLVVDLSREALARAFPDRDAEIAFYCHGKYCPYAAYGAAKAVVWGYRRVYYFAGGFPAWQDAGAPVEVSSGL